MRQVICLSLASLALMVAAAEHVEGSIISDGSGVISAHVNANEMQFWVDTDGVFTKSYAYDPIPGQTALYEAQVSNEGLKTRLTSHIGGFTSVTAGVVDTYTVTGGTIGDVINFNGHFRLTGNSEQLGIGNGNVYGSVGLGLDSNGNITSGNTAIDAIFGQVSEGISDLFPSYQNEAPVVFDLDILVPLNVTVGTPFQLSFSTRIFHTYLVRTDMFNTATVSFDLPPEMTITSIKGFGTIPEPSSLALAVLGMLGIGWHRRKRVS